MAASNLLLLHDGFLLAAPDAGDEDEDQRFHGLPPLKRFKLLQKEMKDLPAPPPSSRPVQVCCLPAKKRVCALRSFASIVDEVNDDEENGNKENGMERFEKYALNEKIDSCRPSLFPDNRGDLASDSLYQVSDSTPAKVRPSLAPWQPNMPNDSMSAQKNGQCAKRMVRPSKKDERSFKEDKIESKKVLKSSEPTEESRSSTQLNLVNSCKLRKKLKRVSEQRKSKEADQSVSSKNGSIHCQTKILRELSRREEASSACAIAKNDQKSFSRKRAQSTSNESKEAVLKRERLIHEDEESVAEERKVGKLKVSSLERKKEVNNSPINRGMEQDSSKSDGFHSSKGINLSKKSGESLLKVMKRTKEELPKVSSKRQEEQTSSEKRNHHESEMLSKKKDFSVYRHDFATTRSTEKDGFSSQLKVLTKSGVHLNVQGKGCADLKPCLQKKRRELSGSDSSSLVDESKDQLKGSDSVKTIAERKDQFKENDPSLSLVDKKGQLKGKHSFKVSCVEGNDQAKRHTPKLSYVDTKEKPCLEGKDVNLCHLQHQKKVSSEEALDSGVKGHHSNSDKHHDSVNVVSQHCFTSDKTHSASGNNNACKEDQSAEDKENNEVGDEDEEDDGVFCDVCKEEDADEEDPIVFCDGCDVMVHASCYGYPLIDGIPDGDWFCKQCIKKKAEKKTASPTTSNESDASSVCCLCPKRGGVMKETMEGAWAHLSCALFVPEVFYRKAREREEIECDQVPSWRWKLPCIFCRKNITNKDDDSCGKGACIQCTEVGCTSTFHVSCAMDEGLSLDILIGNGVSKTPAIVIAFCPTHSQETLSGSERRRFKIVPRV